MLRAGMLPAKDDLGGDMINTAGQKTRKGLAVIAGMACLPFTAASAATPPCSGVNEICGETTITATGPSVAVVHVSRRVELTYFDQAGFAIGPDAPIEINGGSGNIVGFVITGNGPDRQGRILSALRLPESEKPIYSYGTFRYRVAGAGTGWLPSDPQGVLPLEPGDYRIYLMTAPGTEIAITLRPDGVSGVSTIEATQPVGFETASMLPHGTEAPERPGWAHTIWTGETRPVESLGMAIGVISATTDSASTDVFAQEITGAPCLNYAYVGSAPPSDDLAFLPPVCEANRRNPLAPTRGRNGTGVSLVGDWPVIGSAYDGLSWTTITEPVGPGTYGWGGYFTGIGAFDLSTPSYQAWLTLD